MNLDPVDANEDDDIDPEEIDDASEDRNTPENPPEVDARTENLTQWDEPPAPSSGVPPTPFEDETTISQQLAEEGIDEADRDQRLASADPDFEL